jgi:glycosyltransferase involved in cell wall biosynthesis
VSEEPLRILFVSGISGQVEIGGTPMGIRRLGDCLARAGHHVEYWFAEDFPAWAVEGPTATLLFPFALLARLLRSSRFDIVDISSGDGVLAMLLHRAGVLKTARAMIMRSHGSEHLFAEMLRQAEGKNLVSFSILFRARFFVFRRAQVKYSLRWSDRVICYSNEEKRQLSVRLGIPAEKFTVIAPGAAEEFQRIGRPPGKKADQIIFVGNWIWNKGIRFLAPLLRALHATQPGLRLVLAGTHTPGSVIRAEFPEDLREHLDIYPSLPQAELAPLVHSSKLLIFPSDFEGFGLVALEAMAAGTPVVTNANVAFTQWLDRPELAVVVDHELDAYIHACERLLADADYCERMAERGKEWASRFTWEKTAAANHDAYQLALSRG